MVDEKGGTVAKYKTTRNDSGMRRFSAFVHNILGAEEQRER